MLNAQYNNIKNTFRTNKNISIPAVVRYRKQAKPGTITSLSYNNHLTVSFEDGTTDAYHYQYIDMVDQTGTVISQPVVDMTGRKIVVGDLLCYASGTRYSELNIGRVEKISAVGTLSVREIITNGREISPTIAWSGEQRRLYRLNNSDKALVLPISDETLMVWTLLDFKDIKERADDLTPR